MKILHTADVHLLKEGDHRWFALQELIATANNHKVDYLTISGDLFESNADADHLKPKIRDLFQDVGFQTLVIPGNHDAKAYPSGFYFGGDIKFLSNEDWTANIVERQEAIIIGLPFTELDAREFHRRLRNLLQEVGSDLPIILLYHGELLDASYDRGAFGHEEKKRYMPSRLAYFEEAGINYVLAGHFHTSFDVRQFGGYGFFVYPGSPVSITRRETGKRKAALIEVGREPAEIELSTHHYRQLRIPLNAFDQEGPLQAIKQQLDMIDPGATALLEITGTITGSETELVRSVEKLTQDMSVDKLDFHFKDVSQIVSHPVFELFEKHLDQFDNTEDDFDEQDREELRQMVIQAMSEADL